ncbi:hypothetical protein [Streptodolium elevatio]
MGGRGQPRRQQRPVAAGPVTTAGRCGGGWDGWQRLADASDNPDGDTLLRTELAERDRRGREREAAEREAKRPVCTRCGATFSDERWEQVEAAGPRGARQNELCKPCLESEGVREGGERRLEKRDTELAAAVRAAQVARQADRGRKGCR